MRAPSPALQRTEGALRLDFVRRGESTVAAGTYQSGALRVRFPHVSSVPEAVLINTAGGLTGGDALSLSINADAGAEALITTQACEKIYRAARGAVRIETQIALDAGAALDYLPQPTILFDRARLLRKTAIALAEDSRILALEAAVLGRRARQEVFGEGVLHDAWTIRRGGRLVYADMLRLDGTATLGAPWALDRAGAYATLVYAAPDAEDRIQDMRETLRGITETGAASAWNGILLTRLAAPDSYALMRALAHILTAFRRRPLPRLWSI